MYMLIIFQLDLLGNVNFNIIFSRTNMEGPTGEQTSESSVFVTTGHYLECLHCFLIEGQMAFHIYVLDQYEFFEHQEEGCGI